jgi:hypothetical protein
MNLLPFGQNHPRTMHGLDKRLQAKIYQQSSNILKYQKLPFGKKITLFL